MCLDLIPSNMKKNPLRTALGILEVNRRNMLKIPLLHLRPASLHGSFPIMLAYSAASARYQSTKSSPPPPFVSKGKWVLPEIDEKGELIPRTKTKEIEASDKHVDPEKAIIDRGNRAGVLFENRPNVPVDWRKNKDISPWKRQLFALREKFHGQKWNPQKKLSRPAMEGVRYLKSISPELTNRDLASHFKISPESIRRILKSKFQPTAEELADIEKRWKQRGRRLLADRHSKGKSTEQLEWAKEGKRLKKGQGPNKSMKKGMKKVTKVKKQPAGIRDLGNDLF